MALTPAMASLLVGGMGAALPYVWEGGRSALDALGYNHGDDVDLSEMFKAEDAAYAPFEKHLSDEIARLARTGGSAVARANALAGQAGLAGMGPVQRAQARQGEIQGEKAAGGLRREQAMLPMNRFAEQQARSRQDIQAILAAHDMPGARSSRLKALEDAYEGRPQAALYRAAI